MTYLLGRTVPVRVRKSTVIVVLHLLLCNYVTLAPNKVSHTDSRQLAACVRRVLRDARPSSDEPRWLSGRCIKERFGADASDGSG